MPATGAVAAAATEATTGGAFGRTDIASFTTLLAFVDVSVAFTHTGKSRGSTPLPAYAATNVNAYGAARAVNAGVEAGVATSPDEARKYSTRSTSPCGRSSRLESAGVSVYDVPPTSCPAGAPGGNATSTCGGFWS